MSQARRQGHPEHSAVAGNPLCFVPVDQTLLLQLGEKPLGLFVVEEYPIDEVAILVQQLRDVGKPQNSCARRIGAQQQTLRVDAKQTLYGVVVERPVFVPRRLQVCVQAGVFNRDCSLRRQKREHLDSLRGEHAGEPAVFDVEHTGYFTPMNDRQAHHRKRLQAFDVGVLSEHVFLGGIPQH